MRFSIVSVYDLTQAVFKLEVSDTSAQLKLSGNGALDLQPLVLDANTMIFPVAREQSLSSSAGAVPEEGGTVITGSLTGAGATGKLRTEPVPFTVDEAEAEQDAVQTRVCKGPAQQRNRSSSTMRRTSPYVIGACLASRGKRQTGRARITHSSTAVPMCQLDCFFLNLLRCPSDRVPPSCSAVTRAEQPTLSSRSRRSWPACTGCSCSGDQEREKRRDVAGDNAALLMLIAWG